MKNTISVLAGATALASGVNAFWRLPCQSRSGLGRIDPIVDTGVPAAHVHAIHGGNNFGYSTTGQDLLKSTCTSCAVTQDRSAYWTPALYFIHADTGKAEMVWEEGGMLAYYLLYPNPGEQIKAFPTGFQMVSGSTTRRNFTCEVPEPPKSLWSGYEVSQPALAQKALGFNCLNYFDSSKTEPSLYRHYMPSKQFMDENCLSGVRFELMFPSCWNGKDLDSPDHASHVAFPDQVMTGTCPEGFPVRTPSIFFETIWRTDLFKGMDGQFVISNGDPTGYGYHGDFIAAWDDGVLQNAVDTCTNASGQIQDCPVFDIQSQDKAAACTFQNPSSIASENNTNPFAGSSQTGLLGPNPIAYGPAPANGAHGAQGSAVPYSQSIVPVPTVSAKPQMSVATDKYGGQLTVANGAGSPKFGAHEVSPSVTTAAPTAVSAAAAATNKCKSVTTKIVDSVMWEICVETEDITVTMSAEPTQTAHHRRHLHEHAHRNNF